MQDFHPDCIINILVAGHGRPAKFSWAIKIATREQVSLVEATRFLGIVSPDEAGWAALVYSLRQVERLQQEKVMIATDIAYPALTAAKASRSRDPKIQLIIDEAVAIWRGIRLTKMAPLGVPERTHLQGLLTPGKRGR